MICFCRRRRTKSRRKTFPDNPATTSRSNRDLHHLLTALDHHLQSPHSPNLKMTNYTSERAFDETSLKSSSATQSRGRRPYSGPTCTREDTAEGRIFPSLIKWQIQREWGLVEERKMYCHVRLCHVRAPRSDT